VDKGWWCKKVRRHTGRRTGLVMECVRVLVCDGVGGVHRDGSPEDNQAYIYDRFRPPSDGGGGL